MMINRILLLPFLFALSLQVHAEWVGIERVNDKPGEKHYVDWNTVEKNDRLKKVWVLSSYAKEQPGQFRSLKTHYEFNCTDFKVRTVTLLFYPDENASTTPNGARHTEKSEDWFAFSKQSVLNQIAEKICQE